MSYFVFCCYLFIYILWQINYLGWGRESCFSAIILLNYRVSVRRASLFHLVLGIGFVISLWHSMGPRGFWDPGRRAIYFKGVGEH